MTSMNLKEAHHSEETFKPFEARSFSIKKIHKGIGGVSSLDKGDIFGTIYHSKAAF